jgi:hypothetical protein
MSKSPKKPVMCTSCYEIGTIRTILYGMPVYPVNESKYVLGGCVIDEDAPRLRCINCEASIL